MTFGPIQSLLRNDLKVASAFLVTVVVIVVCLEGTYPSVPEIYYTVPTPTQNGGTEEPVLVTEAVVSKSGYTSEGQSTDENFELPMAKVSKVLVELSWTDDIGSNDQLRVTLLREGKELDSAEGTSGSLSFEVSAGDGETLNGNLTVTVQAVDCPGLVGPLPVDRDSGNSWDLNVSATYQQEES